MAKKAKGLKVNVTVVTVPHPNPKRAIEVMAKFVLKELERLDANSLGGEPNTVS